MIFFFYTPNLYLRTGNLDPETQDEIIEIFKKLAYEEQKCIIIVTHAHDVSKEADVIYRL